MEVTASEVKCPVCGITEWVCNISTVVPVCNHGHGNLMPTGKQSIPMERVGLALRVLEVVEEGVTGFRIAEPTVEAISAAVLRFEAEGDRFDPMTLRARAGAYDAATFERRMREFLERALREHRESMRL